MSVMGRVCIYCVREQDPSAFNAEHVIPRAFGMFAQNLTLNCVCAECNDYFGKTIELAYGRDSVEAFLRLIHGTKPADEVGELSPSRLSITLGGDDDWSGCHIELKEEDGQVAVNLVPQVRFAHRRGGWIFVTEEVLADTVKPLPADIDASQDIRLISRSEQMDERLIATLAKRGIGFKKKGEGGGPPPEGGLAPLDLRMRFDAMIFRCVAKIAFNYMASAAGANFTCMDAFDAARAFIRYGTKPPHRLVIPRARPILADDTATMRQTNGHLLTLDWTLDLRAGIGQVSLFNGPTYTVILAQSYVGIWRYIRSGHHFDLETRRVSQLAVARRARRRPTL